LQLKCNEPLSNFAFNVNLRPYDEETAKTLVPSLAAAERFDDLEIQALLDEMANVRKFE